MNSVAQVGNRSAIVTLDYNDNLLYFWQTIGTGRWNKEFVDKPRFGTAPSVAAVVPTFGPGITTPEGAVIAIGEAFGEAGPDELVVSLYTNQPGPGRFAEASPGPRAGTAQTPSVAQVGEWVMTASVDQSGTLWSWRIRAGEVTYGLPASIEQVPGPGSTASQSPSLAQVGDSAVIVAVDQGGSLWFYWQTIGTNLWHPEPVDGPAAGNSDRTLAYPSVAWVGDRSVIVAVDNRGSLWSYWQTIGTGPWNAELVSGAEAEDSTLPYPSVARVGDSAVIAAANTNPVISLWFYWQAIGTSLWNPESVPVSGTVSSSPSVAWVGNSSVITASDDDGNLWYFWQTIGTGGWNEELVASAASLGG
jgi:hypothetical protein